MKSALLASLGCAGLLLLAGCEDKSAPTNANANNAVGKLNEAAKATGTAVKDAAVAAKDATKDAASTLKDSVVAGVQKSYDEAKSKFEMMKSKIAALPVKTQPEAQKLAADVSEGFSKVETKLTELKSAAADKIDTLKTEINDLLAKAGEKLTALGKLVGG